MMKSQHKHLLLEQIIYAFIWILILGTPFVNFLLNEKTFHPNELWKEVSGVWLIMCPFFLLFLIHNYLLIPRLLLKKYYMGYIVSLVFTIGFLFVVLPEGIKVFSPNPDIQEHNISLKKSTPQIRSYCDYPPPLTHKRSEMHPAPLIRPPFLLIHIIVAILLVGFNLTIQLFLKSLHDEEILKELEHQHLESELQYLKYQLNPHFFMNTLNNIHALVDIDGEKAKQTILELSKLMRYVLYEANKSRISLEREIQFLENYREQFMEYIHSQGLL